MPVPGLDGRPYDEGNRRPAAAARPARRRRQGRADRPGHGAQRPHRTAPGGRPARRARRRPRASRPAPRRSAAGGCEPLSSPQVTPAATSGTRPARAASCGCAPGRRARRRRCSRSSARTPSPTRPAGTARPSARGASRAGTGRRTRAWPTADVAKDTITSSLPSLGSASGVIAAPPPTREPLPTATIRIGCAKSATSCPSTSIRSRTNGRLHRGQQRRRGRSRPGRAASSTCRRCGWPGRRRRRARC